MFGLAVVRCDVCARDSRRNSSASIVFCSVAFVMRVLLMGVWILAMAWPCLAAHEIHADMLNSTCPTKAINPHLHVTILDGVDISGRPTAYANMHMYRPMHMGRHPHIYRHVCYGVMRAEAGV